MIRIFTKGSDEACVPLARAAKPGSPAAAVVERTEAALQSFAERGLRTLVLLSRDLGESEWSEWDARYQEAAVGSSSSGGGGGGGSEDTGARQKQLEALCGEVERDLRLVGAVGIEDNLQEGVFDTISLLRAAGINVWMITGDKKETAINIGVSCGLLKEPKERLLVLTGLSPENANQLLGSALSSVCSAGAAAASFAAASSSHHAAAGAATAGPLYEDAGPPRELVIDGLSLSCVKNKAPLAAPIACSLCCFLALSPLPWPPADASCLVIRIACNRLHFSGCCCFCCCPSQGGAEQRGVARPIRPDRRRDEERRRLPIKPTTEGAHACVPRLLLLRWRACRFLQHECFSYLSGC